MLVKAVFFKICTSVRYKTAAARYCAAAVLLFLSFLGEQPRDAAQGRQTYQREHDTGPDGGAAAQQPAHKVELEQAHKAPVDAAHDHQDQADFIKGLHKKDLLPLEPFCPVGRRFIHGQIRRPARRPCPAARCTPASSGALPPLLRRGRMSHPGRCQTPPTHCRSSEPSQRPFHAAEP